MRRFAAGVVCGIVGWWVAAEIWAWRSDRLDAADRPPCEPASRPHVWD